MTGCVALKDGKMIMLRVPYPMGFYAKGFDGRIDDPNAGWKGRGLVDHERRPHAMADGGRQGKLSRAPCTSSSGPIRWPTEVIFAAVSPNASVENGR